MVPRMIIKTDEEKVSPTGSLDSRDKFYLYKLNIYTGAKKEQPTLT
jgi:hypothetical protein